MSHLAQLIQPKTSITTSTSPPLTSSNPVSFSPQFHTQTQSRPPLVNHTSNLWLLKVNINVRSFLLRPCVRWASCNTTTRSIAATLPFNLVLVNHCLRVYSNWLVRWSRTWPRLSRIEGCLKMCCRASLMRCGRKRSTIRRWLRNSRHRLGGNRCNRNLSLCWNSLRSWWNLKRYRV